MSRFTAVILNTFCSVFTRIPEQYWTPSGAILDAFCTDSGRSRTVIDTGVGYSEELVARVSMLQLRSWLLVMRNPVSSKPVPSQPMSSSAPMLSTRPATSLRIRRNRRLGFGW